jgi:hypothetical protein
MGEKNEEKGSDHFTQSASDPFDLEHGTGTARSPLSIGSHYCVLSLTFHHIIFDDWSEGLLFKELATLYNAQVKADLTPQSHIHNPDASKLFSLKKE